MLLTLPIREVLPATPRSRLVRIDLDGRPFPYLAGQAVLVGPHEGARKPFSIAAAPEDAARDGALELLVRVGADASTGTTLILEPGAGVDVEGPIGSFTFPAEPAERRIVFIAGGTGIAPLRAMLRHALQSPLQSPRFEIGLLYSARTPLEFAFEEEFQALARRGRIELRQTVTREVGDAAWTGTRGRIGRDDLTPLVHDPATLCFLCGPPALVEELPKVLEALGVPRQRIRVEAY